MKQINTIGMMEMNRKYFANLRMTMVMFMLCTYAYSSERTVHDALLY